MIKNFNFTKIFVLIGLTIFFLSCGSKLSTITYITGNASNYWNPPLPKIKQAQSGELLEVDKSYRGVHFSIDSENFTVYGWVDTKSHLVYGTYGNPKIYMGKENITLYADIGSSDLNFVSHKTLENQTYYTVDRGNCASIAPKIPDSFHGSPIKAINNLGWKDSYIEAIKLPYWLSIIGSDAFSNCQNLHYIDFANIDNLEIISASAFYNCTSLLSNSSTEDAFYLGRKISKIEQLAFNGCNSLKKIQFHSSPISPYLDIESYTFSETAIVELELPKNINSIGADLFVDCKNFTSLKINSSEPPLLTNLYGKFTDLGNTTAQIKVPNASLSLYIKAWKDISSPLILNPIVGFD